MFPKIQLFIKGLVTVACKSALIFLSGEKKGKEVREERGKKGKQPLQMPHNCTEQMNINVTVKLK